MGELLKTAIDQPIIGILCKSKVTLEVEYTLRHIQKSLGISEFTLKELPHTIQKNMTIVEEIVNELGKIITNE